MNLPACSRIAAAPFGWQCPVLVTAMPLEKSRYSSPEAVVTMQPEPDTTSSSVTLNQTLERCVVISLAFHHRDRRVGPPAHRVRQPAPPARHLADPPPPPC